MSNDRRGFGRFGTALKAYYIINGDTATDKRDCIITNMGRKGFGIQIKADKSVGQNSPILLEIYVPEKKDPTIVKGVVKWIERRGAAWSAGVECLHIINELEFSKLS